MSAKRPSRTTSRRYEDMFAPFCVEPRLRIVRLLHVLRHMPREGALAHEVSIGGNSPVTLAAIAEGCLKHVDNHLAQILG
jgi:hypothetical protein